MAGKGRNLGSIFAFIDLDLDPYLKKLSIAQREMRNVGRKMESAGRSLTLGITAPIVAIGTLAVKASIDFESAFAGVKKTVDGSVEDFARLSTGIVDMSKRLPTSAVELSKIAEIGGQMGIAAQDMLPFVETIAMIGETTNLSTEAAADSLGRLSAVMGTSSADYGRMGSTIVELGNKFVGTEAEIAAMAERISGAGVQVGLTEAQVLGFASAITSVGINAEAGGTAISKLFKDIDVAVATNSKSLELFSSVTNQSVAEFKRAFQTDAAGALTVFLEGLGQLKSEGGNAIQVLDALGLSEIRVSDLQLRLANAGSRVRDSIAVANQAWRENTALIEEAKKRYETMSAQLEVSRNILTSVATVIGDKLAPYLVQFASWVANLATEFLNLNPKTQDAIIAFAAVAAAVGPILVAAGALVTFLGGPLILAFGAVTLAIAASTAAWIKWGDDFPQVEQAVLHVWNSILKGTQETFAAMTTIVNAFVDSVKFAFNFLSESVRAAVQLIAQAAPLSSVVGTAARQLEGMYKQAEAMEKQKVAAKGLVDALGGVDAIKGKWNSFKTGAIDAVTGALGLTQTTAGGLFTDMANVTGEVLKFGKTVPNMQRVNTALGGTSQNLTKIDEAATKAAEAVTKAADAVTDLQKQLTGLQTTAKFEAIEKGIEASIITGSSSGIEEMERQFAEATKAGITAGFIESGGVVNAESQKLIDQISQYEIDKHKNVTLEKKLEAERAAASESEAIFKGLTDQVSSNLAQALRDGFEKGFDKNFMKGLVGSIKSSLFNVLETGIETAIKAALAGGFSLASIGPALAAPLAALTAEKSISGVQSVAQGGRLKADEQAALALPTFGASFAFNPVADLFSGGGSVEGDAREKVSEFLQNTLGAELDFQRVEFETGWAQSFETVAGEGTTAFEALGYAMQEMAGVTEDVGGQIGYTLADNLSGNLDNARLLVQQLGLDAESLSAVFEQMGLAGTKSWAEIEVYQSQVNVLTGEGLVAVGNLRGAYDQLIDSGGRGQTAILALQNIAVEAKEAGVTSVEQLSAVAVKLGLTQEEADRLVSVLQSRGITNMEQLGSASVRTLGSIVAGLEGAGQEFSVLGEGIQGGIDLMSELEEKVKNLDGKEIDLKVNVNYEEHNRPDDVAPLARTSPTKNFHGNVFNRGQIVPFAAGGVVGQKSFFNIGSMAEKGPEAIMPLARLPGGDLGVKSGGGGQSLHINVDARGADAGVELRLVRALKAMGPVLLQQAAELSAERRR